MNRPGVSGSSLWYERSPRTQPAWLDPVLTHAALPRCVVIGAAGTGKTALLQHLAWVLAGNEGSGTMRDPIHRVDRTGVRGDSPIPPVPILHSATTVVAHLQGDRPIREALVALLRSSQTFGDDADAATLRSGIDAGRYIFLIDSLDEVPRRRDREELVSALGTLTGPAPRVIVTTRPSAHTAVELPDGFARVDIAPLDDDATTRLTRAWVACWAPGEEAQAVLQAVAGLRRNVPTQTDELSPLENPLLLSCILHVYSLYRRLPDDTAKLYSDMVRVLCEAKIRAADDRDRDTVVERYREALRELFLASQELGGTRLPVATAHECLVACGFASRITVETWLQDLANHTGLVRFEGGGVDPIIRPWHRSFQEYLAAEAIALNYANRAGDCVTWLRVMRPDRGPRLTDPSWRGTLRFLVGAAALQHRAWGVALLEAFNAGAAERGPDQARLYALAAEGAAEYATSLFQHESIRELLPAAVAKAFAADGTRWPVADRLDALDALGRLGDPRVPDARTRGNSEPDPGWIDVPAGRYKVGSTLAAALKGRRPGKAVVRYGQSLREREESLGGRREKQTERPRFLLSSTSISTATSTMGFWIRRWPVTVAEFFPFAQFASLPGQGALAQASWSRFEPYWRTQLRCPTRPIVNVDWYVARAFCAWAQLHWRRPCGGIIDLPTADEWEIAARRAADRAYPWGDDDPGAGNHAAASYAWSDPPHVREGAAPVGAFPRGHTPEGVWDLAGNVYEWCASSCVNDVDVDLPIDQHNSIDRRAEMILRGGSWARPAEDLLVVRREARMPISFGETVGFRLICRIPGSPPAGDPRRSPSRRAHKKRRR